jgi:hypothetical protein
VSMLEAVPAGGDHGNESTSLVLASCRWTARTFRPADRPAARAAWRLVGHTPPLNVVCAVAGSYFVLSRCAASGLPKSVSALSL